MGIIVLLAFHDVNNNDNNNNENNNNRSEQLKFELISTTTEVFRVDNFLRIIFSVALPPKVEKIRFGSESIVTRFGEILAPVSTLSFNRCPMGEWHSVNYRKYFLHFCRILPSIFVCK